MAHPQFIPLLTRDSLSTVTRYLPSYQEANLPYSLRLPAYRSSYARRFHPYARYHVPVEQYSMEARDELDLLDLSIINVRIPQVVIEPAALRGEHGVGKDGEHAKTAEELQEDDGVDDRNEQVEELQDDGPPVLVDHGIVYANIEQEESRQGAFLRIDMVSALEALHFD